MELYAVALFGALAGIIGLLVGQRMAPKSRTAREMQDFYERSIDTLKKDIKSLRAKVSYYQKGAIPSDLASSDANNPEALIDAVFGALPSNWRPILQQFKPQIVAEMKKDPEAVKNIIEVIKTKVGTSDKQQAQEAPNEAI